MKNITYVFNGLIAVAIFTFSILTFSSCKESTGSSNAPGVANTGDGGFTSTKLPIAYVNVDTLLSNYGYAKDVTERLTKKMEDIRVTINQRGKTLEKEMAEFQRKYENNAFLSQERAQQESARIQKQQYDLEESAQRLQNDWAMEQHKENMQIADSVRIAVKLFNETAKYEMVLNKEDLILANPEYDITSNILTLLNSRYKAEPKK